MMKLQTAKTMLLSIGKPRCTVNLSSLQRPAQRMVPPSHSPGRHQGRLVDIDFGTQNKHAIVYRTNYLLVEIQYC